MAEQQVKSRQRVVDHGEVFTAEREVKAMNSGQRKTGRVTEIPMRHCPAW